MLAVIVTDIILVVLSVLMINLSEKGQYPVFWFGFGQDESKEETAHIEEKNHGDLAHSIDDGSEDNDMRLSSIKESV